MARRFLMVALRSGVAAVRLGAARLLNLVECHPGCFAMLALTGLPITGLPIAGLPIAGLPIAGLPIAGLCVARLSIAGLCTPGRPRLKSALAGLLVAVAGLAAVAGALLAARFAAWA
ncbi:MAG TPA: hypothetical protein PLD10_19255 [Rhodopila sp.]|nr:hypothetical protein [Rhodopila sp.]